MKILYVKFKPEEVRSNKIKLNKMRCDNLSLETEY